MKHLAHVSVVIFAVLTFSAKVSAQQIGGQPVNVVVWGDNSEGETNVPPTLTNAVQVACGADFCVAVSSDGTVTAWGANFQEQTNVPRGITNSVSVTAGYTWATALLANGQVVIWGNYPDEHTGINQVPTNIPPNATNILAVAAGLLAIEALTADGNVLVWDANGVEPVPPNVTNIISIAAGPDCYMALTAMGQVLVWGEDQYGEQNIPAKVTANKNIAVAAGNNQCVSLYIANGSSFSYPAAWGDDTEGQSPSIWNTPGNAIAAGDGFSMCLLTNGTISVRGDLPTPSGLPYVYSIAAGYDNAAAIVFPSVAAFPPTILQQPSSQTVPIGSVFSLRVGASGINLSYQWYLNGTNLITGATNYYLVFTNTTVQQAGSYSVMVSNSVGTVESQAAGINVVPGLNINIVPALSIFGTVGSNYVVQYVNVIGPTNAPWTALDTVTLTNSPQFYSDYSAIGRPQRFYRVMLSQ